MSPEASKEKNKILQIYGLFFVAVLLNFVPSSFISSLGGLLLIVMVIAIYVVRKKSPDNSLSHNHMSYLIKSFWISSLLLLIGIILTYLLGDHTLINNTVDALGQGMAFTPAQLEAILMNYTKQNIVVLLATLLPSLLYLCYRILRGMAFTKKEQPVPNLKSWL